MHHSAFLIIAAIAGVMAFAVAALSVAFTPTPLATGEKIIIQATGQLSAGRNFAPRSAYRNVFIGAAASASPSNILSAYTALFGNLVTGKKIFFRCYVIGSNGIASVPIESTKIIG
jgi:hypothetical protein